MVKQGENTAITTSTPIPSAASSPGLRGILQTRNKRVFVGPPSDQQTKMMKEEASRVAKRIVENEGQGFSHNNFLLHLEQAITDLTPKERRKRIITCSTNSSPTLSTDYLIWKYGASKFYDEIRDQESIAKEFDREKVAGEMIEFGYRMKFMEAFREDRDFRRLDDEQYEEYGCKHVFGEGDVAEILCISEFREWEVCEYSSSDGDSAERLIIPQN